MCDGSTLDFGVFAAGGFLVRPDDCDCLSALMDALFWMTSCHDACHFPTLYFGGVLCFGDVMFHGLP